MGPRERSQLSTGYGLQNGDRVGKDKFYGSENVFRELFVDCCGYCFFWARNRVLDNSRIGLADLR